MSELSKYYLLVTPRLDMPRAQILCKDCALVRKESEVISWPISKEISFDEVFEMVLGHDIEEHR